MALSFFPRLYFQNSPIVRGKTPTLATLGAGSGFSPHNWAILKVQSREKCYTVLHWFAVPFSHMSIISLAHCLSLSLSLSRTHSLSLAHSLSLSLFSLTHSLSLSLSLGHTLSLSTFASLSSSRAPHNHTI